jgi:hypothetical protein
MTRRRKKEEEAWERSAGGNGREEEMEGRRKKKKFSVLEYRIILWVFFFSLYEVADCDWGQKSPLLRPIRREVIPPKMFPSLVDRTPLLEDVSICRHTFAGLTGEGPSPSVGPKPRHIHTSCCCNGFRRRTSTGLTGEGFSPSVGLVIGYCWVCCWVLIFCVKF